jgi:hypothetical protein
MAKIGRSAVSLAAAGVLALAALAAFLALDLAGGSIDPSSLPVIQIGQSSTADSESPAQPAHQPGQGQLDSTSSTSAPGTVTAQGTQTTGDGTTASTAGTTTGSTVRQVINGRVHTGTSGGVGGGGAGSSATSGGSGGAASTNTTGGR